MESIEGSRLYTGLNEHPHRDKNSIDHLPEILNSDINDSLPYSVFFFLKKYV